MPKILLLAPSGFGKTSSIRNLPWERTGIINIDKKDLPIQGWRAKYKTITFKGQDGLDWPDLEKSNYVETSKYESVMTTLDIWDRRPDIDFIVVDTATHLISHDYVKNTIGKDFKAYQGLGGRFYDLLDYVRTMRKNIVIMGHVEVRFNESGEKVIELKSHGNMIRDLVPPSFFTTVLLGEVERKEGVAKYLFRTQSLGNDPAKSPAYFVGQEVKTALDLYEPNDLMLIFEKLKKFEETL